MITAKVGRRGQLTPPKVVHEQLGIEEGQRVAFVMKHGQVALEPLTTTIFDLRGSARVDKPQNFRWRARAGYGRAVRAEGSRWAAGKKKLSVELNGAGARHWNCMNRR